MVPTLPPTEVVAELRYAQLRQTEKPELCEALDFFCYTSVGRLKCRLRLSYALVGRLKYRLSVGRKLVYSRLLRL